MREILSARFIPVLLPMLPIRALRKEARATLVAIGTESLAQLDAILGDPHADPDVRLHVPRTIGFFPPRAAATVLMRHLETADEATITYRILRAVGRCRAADPTMPLDNAVLSRCLEQTLAETFRLLDRRLTLERGAPGPPSARGARRALTDDDRAMPVRGLLTDLLQHRHALATERLFRLVGLLYPSEDARSLYRGVHDPSPKMRDSSRELLEHLLEPPLRGAVLALVDDIADPDRLARAHPYYVRPRLDYLSTLDDLLDHGDAGTVGLVAYHIAEIGAAGLAPRLERLLRSPSPTVVAAVEHALGQIASSEVAIDGQ